MKKLIPLLSLLLIISCSRPKADDSDTVAEYIPELDTATSLIDTVPQTDTVKVEPTDYTEAEYQDGILPVIAAEAPEYAKKLAVEGQKGFIICDKARMKVILYDSLGYVRKEYGMACSKRYGNKHKKADNRTPEGYFNVVGVFDSTDWLYTDDNGKQSKKKGQFGPRFIRINSPQIGIHGTCAPWSIGHRASHGCMRLTNENIMELSQLVHAGMPVIILPGKRDREVNHNEGSETIYFATSSGFEMKESEKEEFERARKAKEEAERQKAIADSIEKAKALQDSLEKLEPEHAPVIEPEVCPEPVEPARPAPEYF